MLIFFQQLCLLLFLWLLKLVDGLMEIFSAISGITDVTYKGEKVNIIEFLAGDSTVNTIFWCIFILAIGLTCIFTIAALIKNMINSHSQCENYAIVKKSQFQYGITGDIGMVCGNTSLRIVASVEEDKYCIFGR